jgi:hypothetical protein
MKPPMKLRVLLVFTLIFYQIPHSAWADDETLKTLKNEVQELKETVRQLKEVVEYQNKRIETLEGKEVPKTEVVQEESTPQKTPGEEFKNVAETPPAETAPSPDYQTAQPQTPSTYRQYGFWSVPVNPQGPSRFLPDISVNGVFAAAYFSQEPVGPTGHDPSRTGFNLQEIELAIQSVIDPYIRADIYLSFGEEGVELEEGYITTLSLPTGLQVKGGLYLLPFGRQNPKHLEKWAFVDNNLVNQRIFGPEQFRELGFEISYLFPTPFFFLIQANMTQGNNDENFNGMRKGDFAYTYRVSGSGDLTDNLTLLAGTSGAFGWNDSGGGGDLTQIYGGDLLLSWRPSPYTGIDWQTEYIYRHRQVPFGAETEGGLYSYLLGKWSKRWGAGFRIDYMGLPVGVSRTLRLSPMVVFRTTEWFQVKAQYEYVNDSIMGSNHNAFLQWIFTMGPHGAHPF